jgi:hypothetical protein
MSCRARGGLAILVLLASCGVWAGSAEAQPVSGPHETLDNQFSTTQPNSAAGFSFKGHYHAAGDPGANPPYMRKMVFYQPPGLRYDTSVPERCSASDVELAVRGAAACPAASRLGGGTASSIFLGTFPSTLVVDFFNNTGEQIILARSPGLASVARGQIRPDGSVEFASPTCFPTVQPAGCPVDDVLQIESSLTVAPYTRSSGGVVRSYLTTPPRCPAAGHWQTPVRLWWADGSVDRVITEQACTRRRSAHRRGRHTARPS